MANWHDYVVSGKGIPKWPYPIRYDREQVIETDVLVLGGGISGCWAAISAARRGVKWRWLRSPPPSGHGAGGPGCDHWCEAPANPSSKVDPEWRATLQRPRRYGNGIGYEIQCRENYDTLLEMEKMGGKIRDTEASLRTPRLRRKDTPFVFSPRATPFMNQPGDSRLGDDL